MMKGKKKRKITKHQFDVRYRQIGKKAAGKYEFQDI